MKRQVFMILGVVLAGIPSLFPTGFARVSAICLLLGVLFLVIAAVRAGGANPRPTLYLLLASNAAYYLCYGLWHLRLKIAGPSLGDGVDPFAQVLTEWMLVFMVLSVYEVVVFLWGAIWNRQQIYALLGLIALFLQWVISIVFAINLAAGGKGDALLLNSPHLTVN